VNLLHAIKTPLTYSIFPPVPVPYSSLRIDARPQMGGTWNLIQMANKVKKMFLSSAAHPNLLGVG
jgi:hypothetical protein